MKQTNAEVLAKMVSTYTTCGDGKKQCPKCEIYIDTKSKLCKCGNTNFNSKVMVDGKEINTYGEPKRGRRQCQKCYKYIGNRIPVCPCGYKFIKGGKLKKVEPKPLEYYKAKAIAEALDYSGFHYIVYTPCGSCPVKLRKTGKISEWVENVLDVGSADGLFYAPSAIKYFGMEFYDYHDEKYKKLCRLVDKWVKKLIGDDYPKEDEINIEEN